MVHSRARDHGASPALVRVLAACSTPLAGEPRASLGAREPDDTLGRVLLLAVAAVVIVVAAIFVIRRVDVRLVLLLGAVVMFVAARQLPSFFVFVAKEMANEKTIVPICSAMGFASVVKLTGCDRHLVRLLLRPLEHARPLLVPGGIVAAFLVNTAIVSQSSTAATVGAVLIPLLLAGGITAETAGAALLLGASVGGELFNPGAVEIVTLAKLTAHPPVDVVRRVMPGNLLASGVALAVFCALAIAHERRARLAEPAAKTQSDDAPPADVERLHFGKALVPVLPLAILFLLPRFVALPAELTTSVMIGAAMLAGVAAAGLSAPALSRKLMASFFEGAGYAYTHIISLIVTATVFTEGVKATGLIDRLAVALSTRPLAATLASVAVPLPLATATGSGIAPAVAVMNVLVPMAAAVGLDGERLGALTAVAAQLGRTMSPAAAVVAMCATISGVSLTRLVLRVAPPLLAAAGALLVAGLCGLI